MGALRGHRVRDVGGCSPRSKKVDQLSDEDQQALVVLLDSLMARANLQKLMGESQNYRR